MDIGWCSIFYIIDVLYLARTYNKNISAIVYSIVMP